MRHRPQLTKSILSKYMLTGQTNLYGLGSCCVVLMLLIIAVLCPLAPNKVEAESTSVSMQNSLPSTVSLAVQNGIDFDVTPTIAGGFGAGTAELVVSTSNSSGYSLYLKTENGESTLTNAKGDAITAISGERTSENFPKNTWGYALNQGTITPDATTTYKAVPTTATDPISDTTTASGNTTDTYTLAFGAKIATDLPSGEYVNNVIVSAIANPMELTSLNQLTYMQEMTKDICAASAEHEEKMLIDERDNNSYYVTKLKDGNCWMTQNLALDIDGTKVYGGQTQAGVPISYVDGTKALWSGSNGNGWAPNKTEASVPGLIAGGGQANNTRSWNLGKYVLSEPSGSSTGCTVKSGGNLGTTCTKFKDVSGSGWEPTWTAHDVNGVYMAYNEATSEYDPHYLVGNYYQYNTAVAGTGTAMSGDGNDATASICPDGVDGGWVLPLSKSSNDSASGSFKYLLNQYGATSTSVVQLPLAFVRSGMIEISWGQASNVNLSSYVRSRTSVSSTHAYVLLTPTGSLYPSFSDHRWLGFPVRCLFLGK